MSLETNYELLEMLHDDGVQSFRAREIATGRALEVHLFIPFGRPENRMLFDKLRSLPVDARRMFLDSGTDGSTPYIVTDPLPPPKGFKSWAAGLVESVMPVAPPVPARQPIDDSVRIIQAGQWRTGTPMPEGLVSAPPQPPPEPPRPAQQTHVGDITTVFKGPLPASRSPAPSEPPPSLRDTATLKQPGEFTQLFQALKQPESAPVPPAPIQPVTQKAPPAGGEPGEFTRMFTAGIAQPAPERMESRPEPMPEPQQPAGEFTRMFQQQAPPGAPAPPPSSRPEPPPNEGASEFTKFFQSPLQPAPQQHGGGAQAGGTPYFEPPPMAPPPARRASEFTDIFGKPAAPVSGQPPPAPSGGGGFYQGASATGAFSAPPVSPRQLPSSYSGPSEYTKMMSPSSMPTLGQPAPPPPAPPAPASANKSMMPVIVLLGALLVMAVLVVLFFALRTK